MHDFLIVFLLLRACHKFVREVKGGATNIYSLYFVSMGKAAEKERVASGVKAIPEHSSVSICTLYSGVRQGGGIRGTGVFLLCVTAEISISLLRGSVVLHLQADGALCFL